MSRDTPDAIDELARAYRSIEAPPESLQRILARVREGQQQSPRLPVWGAAMATGLVLAIVVALQVSPPDNPPQLAIGPDDLQVPPLSSLAIPASPPRRTALPSLGDLSGISLSPVAPKPKTPAKPPAPKQSDSHTPFFIPPEEHEDDTFA